MKSQTIILYKVLILSYKDYEMSDGFCFMKINESFLHIGLITRILPFFELKLPLENIKEKKKWKTLFLMISQTIDIVYVLWFLYLESW